MRTRSEESGFSLIDLMIGAMVSIILIGAVLTVIVHQGHLRQSNTETSLALNACMNTLENMRALDTSGILTMNGTGFDIPGPNGQPNGLTPVAGDLDGLPGAVTVVIDQSSGGNTLYLVVCSVTWTGVTGRRIYSMQTVMGERK